MMKKYKILIVEDNEALNQLFNLTLSRENYICTSVYDGKSALESITQYNYDLVLLDYKLPDFTAKEILEKINSLKKSVNFIVITGHGDEKIAVEVMKLGALDYLVKEQNLIDVLPINIKRILKSITTNQNLENTRRKLIESGKLYRTLLKQLPDIVIIHKSGKILYINEAVHKILPFNTYKGKTLLSLFPPVTGASIVKNLQRLKNGEPIGIYEINLEGNDGAKKYLNVQSEEIKYKGEKAIITVLTDVTKAKEAEENILQKTIEIQEKERARIAEDIHDDLGPILSSIKIYSGLLFSKNKNQKDKKEYALKIQELVDSAIKNTRTISNNLMPNALKDYGLINAIGLFCETLNKTNFLKINYTYDNFELDKTQEIVIYRVLTELINNSLKHSGCSIIDLEIRKRENEKLWIYYKDNGCGLKHHAKDKKRDGRGLSNIFNRLASINAQYSLFEDDGFGLIIKKDSN